MSELSETVGAMFALVDDEDEVEGNAEELVLLVATLKANAPEVNDEDLGRWIEELAANYETADDISSDPLVFAEELKRLILELGNEGYLSE